MNNALKIENLEPSNFGGSEFKLSLAARFLRHCSTLKSDYDPQTEWPHSHIEILLGGALDVLLRASGLDFRRGFKLHPVVFPQRSFGGRFHADLTIDLFSGFGAGMGGDLPFWLYTLVVIECDGHNFHAADKRQAAQDAARDRYLSRLGLRVLRFTGSEIQGDPMACAWEALSVAGDVMKSEDSRVYFDSLPTDYPSGEERARLLRQIKNPLRAV